MSDSNYSHILIIKIWSTISETTTDYCNIENILKEELLEKKWSHKGIQLIFKKINLSPIDKALGLSNIVIDNPFDSDETLLFVVTNIINYIDKEFHKMSKLNKSNKIIFKVIKPLNDRIEITESIKII